MEGDKKVKQIVLAILLLVVIGCGGSWTTYPPPAPSDYAYAVGDKVTIRVDGCAGIVVRLMAWDCEDPRDKCAYRVKYAEEQGTFEGKMRYVTRSFHEYELERWEDGK